MATFQPDPGDELELGLAGHITTDRWLAIAGGLLGGALVLLGWGLTTVLHLNRTARSHRP